MAHFNYVPRPEDAEEVRRELEDQERDHARTVLFKPEERQAFDLPTDSASMFRCKKLPSPRKRAYTKKANSFFTWARLACDRQNKHK